jgi:hypothetical protein
MKCATVVLLREAETSAVLNKTYEENIRGISDIKYTATHIIFELIFEPNTDYPENNIIAYKADRISEFYTYEE